MNRVSKLLSAPFIFWVAGAIGFLFLLNVLSGVLLPFVAGIAVAYFLDPLADRLEKTGASRLVATCLILAVFFLVFIGIIVLLFPPLQSQIIGLINRLPDLLAALREQAAPLLESIDERLTEDDIDNLRDAAKSYFSEAIAWAGSMMKGVLNGGVALLQIASLVFITPLVSFYLIRDWDRIITQLDDLLPRSAAPVIRQQIKLIDNTIAGFVRGQATVCLILSVIYGIGLSLIGLDFGLLVGIGAGLISFIPYFGAITGLAVALGIALTQFSDWIPVALTVSVFAVGQILEGNFLTPVLVGSRIGLHPAWIIFALLAGGSLFGFTGILLAIPIAAVAGVLIRFAIGRYRDSALYLGPDAPADKQ